MLIHHISSFKTDILSFNRLNDVSHISLSKSDIPSYNRLNDVSPHIA